MQKVRLIFLGLLAVGVVGVALPASASAAHFYLQNELDEEFKPITSTVEATVESNGTLEWKFELREVRVLCHAEAREKLFTSGKDEMEKFKISACSSGSCTVSWELKEGPYHTALGERGSPITYTDDIEAGPEVVFYLSGVSCNKEHGPYEFEPIECESTVDNTIDLELVFPENPGESEGCRGRQVPKYQKMAGRVRLVPTVGRTLRVGP
jgi:hypothetical protein